MRDKIRSFVRSNLNIFNSDAKFNDEDNIFRKGFVDSLFAVKLVSYLETEFPIKIANQDLNISNFQSVDKMVEFVEAKLENETQAGAK